MPRQTSNLQRILPPEYPFHIGTRFVPVTGPDGEPDVKEVPLTEEDFLHPQEEDRFLLTDSHTQNVDFLRHAITWSLRGIKGIRVFSDHRIDWQRDDIPPMGPDIVVFADFPESWNGATGTVHVQDVGCRPLGVIEVTSPSTRHIDLKTKLFLYQQAKIPFFITVDLVVGEEGYIMPDLFGYRLTPEGYVRMAEESDGRLPVPDFQIVLQMEGDRVVAFDQNGQRIPKQIEAAELAESRQAELIRVRDLAEKSEQWAMMERAEKEKERAEKLKQKARADALEAELAKLISQKSAP